MSALPPKADIRRRAERRSRQFRDELHVFVRRPNAGSASAHIAQRAKRQNEFRNVVAIRCFDERDEITLAAGEVKMFDLDTYLLGEIAGGLRALWCRP